MNPILAILNGWEVLGLVGIIMMFFGAKKLPLFARSLGQSIKEFRNASR